MAYSTLFEKMGDCVAGNSPLSTYACKAMEDPAIEIKFASGKVADEELCYSLNLGMVVQRITEMAVRHTHIRSALSFAMGRQSPWIMEAIAKTPWETNASRMFAMQKLHSVFTSRGDLSTRPLQVDAKAVTAKGFALATNIFEASHFQ